MVDIKLDFRRIASGLAGLIVLAAPSAGHLVYAATATCDLQVIGSQLKNARMPGNDDSLASVRAALATRKAILKTLIECGRGDALALRDTVKNLSLYGDDTKMLQQSLVSNLDEAIASYERYATQVLDVGIRSSQDVARSLLAWRKAVYIPLEARASHFIIWANNQDVFDKAGKRIIQVSQIMRSLSLLDNEDIKKSFSDAQHAFENAKQANNDARTVLLKKGEPENELAIIKRSLELLATTYAHLFELSKMLGK